MMKNKNGFTLIELLSILIILALIALIAVPIVSNLIQKTRISAAETAISGLFDAVDVYYGRQIISGDGVFNNNETMFIAFGETFDENVDGLVNGDTNIEYNGTPLTAGKISVDRNGKITVVEELIVNGYYCGLDKDDKITCSETKGE